MSSEENSSVGSDSSSSEKAESTEQLGEKDEYEDLGKEHDEPLIIKLPSYDDDSLKSELENGRIIERANELKNSENDFDPKGTFGSYFAMRDQEKEEYEKLLYFDNKKKKEQESLKPPPYRPWTEKELRDVPLTKKERQKAPLFHKCTQFFDGMGYPTYSIYYCFRYCLFRYLVVDMIVFLFLLGAMCAATYIIAWRAAQLYSWFTGSDYEFDTKEGQKLLLLFFQLFILLALFAADQGVNILNIWINKSKRKTSNVTEQIMKGTKSKKYLCYSPEVGEDKGGFFKFIIGVIVDRLTLLFVKLVIYLLIVPFAVTLLDTVTRHTGAGASFNIIMMFITVCFDNAARSFSIPLNRRRFRYRERILFVIKYFPLSIGFGFSVMAISFIPGINIFYYLCCDYIAGTRLFLHLEYRCGPHKEYEINIPKIVYQTTVLNNVTTAIRKKKKKEDQQQQEEEVVDIIEDFKYVDEEEKQKQDEEEEEKKEKIEGEEEDVLLIKENNNKKKEEEDDEYDNDLYEIHKIFTQPILIQQAGDYPTNIIITEKAIEYSLNNPKIIEKKEEEEEKKGEEEEEELGLNDDNNNDDNLEVEKDEEVELKDVEIETQKQDTDEDKKGSEEGSTEEDEDVDDEEDSS